jgi:transposase-like protein
MADRQEESLTVYTDGFRAYGLVEAADAFDREYVVHGDGEYADDEVIVNTCESHRRVSDAWLSPHRGISKDKLTPYLRAFQFCSELHRKPGRDALKYAVRATL